MQYTFEEAKELIWAYASNQVEQTKQANSRRGITKKSCKEEVRAVRNLLTAIILRPPTDEEIKEITNQF